MTNHPAAAAAAAPRTKTCVAATANDGCHTTVCIGVKRKEKGMSDSDKGAEGS